MKRAVAYAKETAAKGFFEKGMEKGREEGKEEALLQTARNLLEVGVSIADIVKATGLSEEQILAAEEGT